MTSRLTLDFFFFFGLAASPWAAASPVAAGVSPSVLGSVASPGTALEPLLPANFLLFLLSARSALASSGLARSTMTARPLSSFLSRAAMALLAASSVLKVTKP